jgi:hypothetical protein
LPKLWVNRSSNSHRSRLGRLLSRAQVRVDPVRGRDGLWRGEGAERRRRDERAVEARAEIVRLRRRLVRVRRGEGLRRRLRLAQLDGGCERRGRGRGVPKRMAVGGFARACDLLRIV